MPRKLQPFATVPAAQARDLSMSERDFKDLIRDMAAALGWDVYEVIDTRVPAKRTSKGFPDQYIIKDGKVLALEAKTETGRATPDQEWWITILDTVPGITARIVRPSDLDWIQQQLEG